MPNPMEISENGITMGTSTSTGTSAAPVFDCALLAKFTAQANFNAGVKGVNTIRINGVDYTLRIGTAPANNTITFVI